MLFGKKTAAITDEALLARLEMLEKVQTDLVKLTRTLTDDLSKLEEQHERLRGKVYAHKMHKQTNEDEAPAEKPMSRDELKRSLARTGRFIPGRPPVHEK